MDLYTPILVLGAIAAAFAVGSVGIAVLIGPRRYNHSKLEAYECGIEPMELSDPAKQATGQRFPIRYYLTAMRTHGEVTECHGNIDFRRSHPVCRGRMFSHSTQLAVGTEERHRLVSVKPRGNGSEYSLVYVQVNGES